MGKLGGKEILILEQKKNVFLIHTQEKIQANLKCNNCERPNYKQNQRKPPKNSKNMKDY